MLGGLPGWRTSKLDGAAVSNQGGLCLAATPSGPLSLSSSDGSLGGLVLPQGLCFDRQNLLYLLNAGDSRILRFDPDVDAFRELPEVGGVGSDPRQFRNPSNIAIAGNRLCVADAGNARVQIFDVASLALTTIWQQPNWAQLEITASGQAVYVLDSSNGRVYVSRTPDGPLICLIERGDKIGRWTRLIVDLKGKLYLLDSSDPAHPVLDVGDQSEGPFADAGDVRDRFAAPSLRLDAAGRFCLPPSLARACDRSLPIPPPAPEMQLQLCPPFDRTAKRCASPKAPVPARAASCRGNLYVADREKRLVQVFTDSGRKLRNEWGPFNGNGTPVSASDADAWDPVDVAADDGIAVALDAKHQAVFRHMPGREQLRLVLVSTAQNNWLRIAAQDGLIYLYCPGQKNVQVYDCSGEAKSDVCYARVAALFEAAQPSIPSVTGLIFNQNGTAAAPVDPSSDMSGPVYLRSGAWTSIALDSQKYRCQWHRILLTVLDLPPGSKIEALTYVSDVAADVSGVDDSKWQSAGVVVAPATAAKCGTAPDSNFEFLIQSGPGEFLSLRLKLTADGYSTPIIASARIFYPRESYLNFLPATFSSDDESRVFLDRFLSIFQTEWDAIQTKVNESERYFDPDAVPGGPALESLAKNWLALPLEETWTDQQKRQLLSAAPKIYEHIGQAKGFRDYLAAYLSNITGLDLTALKETGFPAILEGFRERQFLFLSKANTANLNDGAPLWSPDILRRLQLGVYAQLGEVELVSTGDPARDIFQQYAHQFRVFLPGAWVRTATQETMLRRAIEAQKPAHTSCELELVEAHFVVGQQSTVGLDTILGALPEMRVGCGAGDDAAPSLPKRNRLGYDSVLASRGSTYATLGTKNQELVLG